MINYIGSSRDTFYCRNDKFSPDHVSVFKLFTRLSSSLLFCFNVLLLVFCKKSDFCSA